jgi:hypothetical protein
MVGKGPMRTPALVFILALAGCASLQNTPAQERVWARYAVCSEEFPRHKMIRVYPDGQFISEHVGGEDPAPFFTCMTGKPTWEPGFGMR